MPSDGDQIVLAFDTAAPHCAAALLCGDAILASRREEMTRGQVESLLPLLERLLSDARLRWRDLGRIGVGVGPGNFTGTRISIATARGLTLSLGLPAIGVTTLEAQAFGLGKPVVSLAPATRGQVYAQVFSGAPDAPRLCTLPEGLPEAPRGTLCVGPLPDEAAAQTGWTQVTPPENIAENIARIAAIRPPGARPAPLYMTPAGAAPPSDPPPVILP